jgi:hypothetical protein
MAITLTSNPDRVRAEPDGYYNSFYVCAFNPITFEFERTSTELLKISLSLNGVNVVDNVVYTFNSVTNRIKIDISGLIQSGLSSIISNTYVNSNELDDKGSVSYELFYSDENDNSQGSHDGVAVFSAKQIGDKYGANLADFIGSELTTTETGKGKFLTVFDELAYFKGFNFSVSYINNGQPLLANLEFNNSPQKFITLDNSAGLVNRVNFFNLLDGDVEDGNANFNLKLQKTAL